MHGKVTFILGKKSSLLIAASLLFAVCLFTGFAGAGTITADTTGISTVEVGTTVQVPVIVTGAESLSAYQIVVNTGDTAAASISVDTTSSSVRADETTGIVIWTGGMRGESLDGDQTLFMLDVTPKQAGEIELTVTVDETFQGTTPMDQVYTYTGATSKLIASGTGSPAADPSGQEETKTPAADPASSTGTNVNPSGSTPKETVSPTSVIVSPTQTPDAADTAEPVVSTPVSPTVIPVAADTAKPAASPLGIAAVAAGLGIAAVFLRKEQ